MKKPRWTLRFSLLVVAGLGILLAAVAERRHRDERIRAEVIRLGSLPDFNRFPDTFRSDPYLRAASRLQGLGHGAALEALSRLAEAG